MTCWMMLEFGDWPRRRARRYRVTRSSFTLLRICCRLSGSSGSGWGAGRACATHGPETSKSDTRQLTVLWRNLTVDSTPDKGNHCVNICQSPIHGGLMTAMQFEIPKLYCWT